MDLLITVGAVALGAGIWLWILRRYDRVEPEAVRHLVTVGVVGGLGSVLAAAALNEGAQHLLGITADVFHDAGAVELRRLVLFCLLVGFSEEICKAVATVFTTRRLGDLDEPIDAMIYAMTVGLGFAAFENGLYASRFGNDVLLVRFLWPVPAHMAYSAIWGYGLARVLYLFPRQPRMWRMATWVAGAAVLHGVCNFLLFLESTLAAMASLAVLAGLAVLVHEGLGRLLAESPYLAPGECPYCRTVNPARAPACRACGEPFLETELFEDCPCGRFRIPQHAARCPQCARPLLPEQKQAPPASASADLRRPAPES